MTPQRFLGQGSTLTAPRPPARSSLSVIRRQVCSETLTDLLQMVPQVCDIVLNEVSQRHRLIGADHAASLRDAGATCRMTWARCRL